MSLKAVQKVIKDHLKSHFPGFDVESWKRDIKEYDLLAPEGAIILRYAHSKFGKPEALGAIIQEELLTFIAVLITRDIQDDEATTNHLDILKQVLIGLEVEPAHKIRLIDAKFLYESQGLYWHGVVFTVTTELVEQQEELIGPNLTEATFMKDSLKYLEIKKEV